MNKVDGDAQQATMTDVRIQDIYKQLPTKDQAPVSFFEFCFEPNSFEEGVERVFDLRYPAYCKFLNSALSCCSLVSQFFDKKFPSQA